MNFDERMNLAMERLKKKAEAEKKEAEAETEKLRQAYLRRREGR